MEKPGMKTLTLHPGRERRILRGHRWVFSNEIADPIHDFEPGSWVEVLTAKGLSLGAGYVNPASLIAVRLVCPPGKKPDEKFFRQTLLEAANLRQSLYPGAESYRVVFGESDRLPGLVVDRYGDVLVYQAGTVGMAGMEELMRQLLLDLFRPAALVFRNDSPSRALEGLAPEKGVACGSLTGDVPICIDGIRYLVDVLGGQKTGMYLDQRDNRNAAKHWMKGKRVLDLFCYNGAWSLSAVAGGAAEAIGVDQSRRCRSGPPQRGAEWIRRPLIFYCRRCFRLPQTDCAGVFRRNRPGPAGIRQDQVGRHGSREGLHRYKPPGASCPQTRRNPDHLFLLLPHERRAFPGSPDLRRTGERKKASLAPGQRPVPRPSGPLGHARDQIFEMFRSASGLTGERRTEDGGQKTEDRRRRTEDAKPETNLRSKKYFLA